MILTFLMCAARQLAVDRAVARDAGLLDRVQRDLGGAIARRAEGADGLAGVVLLPAGDDRLVGRDAGDVRGEVRDVRAGHLELRPGRSSRRRRTPSPSCPARSAAGRTSARRPASASGRTRCRRRSAPSSRTPSSRSSCSGPRGGSSRRRPSSATTRPRPRGPTEYGSWKSMSTTFFTFSLLIM